MSLENIETLSRICINGVCHCDWRLTLQGCVESKAMTIVNYINIGLSGIAIVVGTALLSHRIFIKDHKLFEIIITQGCFRPKPIECMLAFITVFNLLRLLSSTVLIVDAFPDMVSRSFMYEIPWQFGFGGFALYLIGIAQTLADSHRAIANSWLPSPRLANVIGCTIFLSPFLMNNVFSVGAGIFAKSDLALAQTFTRSLYILWCIHCTSLSAAVFFSGYRLIGILGAHLKKFNTTGPRYASVKTGIFKIRAVKAIILTCLLMFAVFLLVWGIMREVIIKNKLGSIVLGAIWNFLGVITTLGVEFAIIFNPKVDEPYDGFGLKSSSCEKCGAQAQHNSNFSKQEYSTSASNHSCVQVTTSHGISDNLKIQQLQYQKVFQEHNQHQHHLPPNPTRNQKNMQNLPTTESRQVNVSATGHILIEDAQYYPNPRYIQEKKFSLPPRRHHQLHRLDDDHIIYDGESSQIDLVECANVRNY